MEEKLAKRLIAALEANTKAVEEHTKLMGGLTGRKPRPQPEKQYADPLTRFLEGR